MPLLSTSRAQLFKSIHLILCRVPSLVILPMHCTMVCEIDGWVSDEACTSNGYNTKRDRGVKYSTKPRCPYLFHRPGNGQFNGRIEVRKRSKCLRDTCITLDGSGNQEFNLIARQGGCAPNLSNGRSKV